VVELLALLLTLAVFALWISNRNLKARLDYIELRLGQGAVPAAPVETAVPSRSPAEVEGTLTPDPEYSSPAFAGEGDRAQRGGGALGAGVEGAPPPASGWSPSPANAGEDLEPGTPERETLGVLFERLVGGRLLIWLGGIALVVAAIYLIRYSIEIGLVTPELRMAGAGLFGLTLLGAGEYARGRRFGDDPRIAQALVGAGIAVLYATAYGSHSLYGLIGPAVASAAMLAITLAALGLSLRHGAPTALMGLAGGFLTPLLVGDPESGAVPLLAYLAMLNLALFLIAWRRGWTWLAAAAVGLWSAFLLSQPADDALATGAFVILLAIAASLVRPGPGRALGLIQPMLVGIVQLAFLAARTDLGFLGWMLFGILAAASMALAALRREYRFGPPVALALAVAILSAKAGMRVDPFVLRAMGMVVAIFGLGGLALALWKGRPLWTAVAAAGLSLPLLAVRAAWPELLDPVQWGGIAAALAIGAALLIWRSRARASAVPPADWALLAAAGGAALLACAAIWDLAPERLVPAGWLAVALALAFATRRLGDLALGTVAALAALLAVLRAMALVPELSITALASLLGEPALAADLPDALTALLVLALPAALLAGMRWALPQLPFGARSALLPAAGVLGVGAAYIWFKQAFGLAGAEDFVARGFLERLLITQALFAAGWLIGSGRLRRIDADLARAAATALTIFATARLIWFDLLVHNPSWSDQWVGPWPVINLIAPAYLLSAFWLYAARRRAQGSAGGGAWLAAFLMVLIAGAALLVRQAFQGAILSGPDSSIAEYYGYSLAGLIVSIGLLVAGIRLPDKALRLAGLLLLTATMVKVFLVDASALEGVLRILSFLGLGIVLIGIGRLYGPVLRAEAGGGVNHEKGEAANG